VINIFSLGRKRFKEMDSEAIGEYTVLFEQVIV